MVKVRIEPRANFIWSYNETLSSEPLVIELTEMNGHKGACIHNPGWLIQQVREDKKRESRIRCIGFGQLEDLKCGGYHRQEALQEIWENANEAFNKLIGEGYRWEDALRIARANDCKELDYLEGILHDNNRLLRRERMNAFDAIERRESVNFDRMHMEVMRADSFRKEKKFRWPWQKRQSNAAAM